MVTAYDFPTAQMADAAGLDMILVGDSVGTVVQGRATTLGVTLDEMIYHSKMVAKGAKRALVVVDMPFPYCQLGPAEAVRACARVLRALLYPRRARLQTHRQTLCAAAPPARIRGA